MALGDMDLHFVWQAWHLATRTSTLCGRRGTYGTELGLVTRLVAFALRRHAYVKSCSHAALLRVLHSSGSMEKIVLTDSFEDEQKERRVCRSHAFYFPVTNSHSVALLLSRRCQALVFVFD
eukprot:s5104_g2.t1